MNGINNTWYLINTKFYKKSSIMMVVVRWRVERRKKKKKEGWKNFFFIYYDIITYNMKKQITLGETRVRTRLKKGTSAHRTHVNSYRFVLVA